MQNFMRSIATWLMFFIFYSFILIKRIVLSVLRSLLLFRGAQAHYIPDAVLVLKVGGLGDFIFGIPALNLLRERLPNAKICLITAKSLSGLRFEFSHRDPQDASELPWINFVRPSVDEVLVVHDLSFKMISKISNLIPREKNIGIFILGYPGMTISSAFKKILFARMLTKGRAVCVGIDKKLDDHFMRKFQGRQGLYRHKMLGDVDSIMEGFPKQSFFNKDLNFKVPIAAISESKIIKSLVAEAPSKEIILIAPVATTLHKQWPLDNFVRLTQELKKSRGQLEFLLVGTREQFDQVAQAYKDIGFDANNLCGLLSIDELASLFSVAKGYIGNDGGMSQLAGLVGCPSVIVFNSVEEDWVTHPWRSENGVVRNRPACSPCYNGLYCPEGHRRCVTDISLESVLLKVHQIIFKYELQISERNAAAK
jgi:ADP-heptose:LPS heptosyltransferase